MSIKEMLIAVFKAVINSAEEIVGGFKKTLRFIESNNSNQLVIGYFCNPLHNIAWIAVKLPWYDDVIEHDIYGDSDLNDLYLVIKDVCNNNKSKCRLYFHNNLPKICAMFHINVD